MTLFRNMSIRRKQMLVIMLTSACSLLLACGSFVWFEIVAFRAQLVSRVSCLAEVVGYNCAPALDFRVPATAELALAVLRDEPAIRAAFVYANDGSVFATYRAAYQEPPPSQPPASYKFVGNHLFLRRPVVYSGATVGSILLVSDLNELSHQIAGDAEIVGLVFVASLLVAFGLSSWLQKLVSGPILGLAQAARSIAARKDYSVRVAKQSEDELGQLMESFNEMLAEIQARDGQLRAARDTMEMRVTDRTAELAAANTALLQSEKRFRALFENARDAIFIHDNQGVILDVNREGCERLQYSRGELLGRSVQDLDTPECAALVPQRIARLRTVGHQLFEAAHRRRDGTVVPVEINSQLIVLEGQELVLSFCRDLTERKRAEARIEEANKQLMESSRQAGRAEVATNVLHNVGNVLNSVNVSAGLLMSQARSSSVSQVARLSKLLEEHRGDLATFLTSEKGAQLLRYVGALGGNLDAEQATLVKELRELSNNVEHIKDIVAMQQDYARVCGVSENLSVAALAEDALRIESASLAREDIRVVRHFQDVPPILVDKHKVLQILINLISNAKHALTASSVADKQLTLAISAVQNGIQISVGDNGIGIAAENLTRIFSHGFTMRSKGHGFGLHSSALAARAMGGSLTVHSEGLGNGATFTLELSSNGNGVTEAIH